MLVVKANPYTLIHNFLMPTLNKVCIGVLTLPLLLSCVTSVSHWEEAQWQNTVSAYNNFILTNPESEYAPEARRRIDRMSFEQAERIGDKKDYESYIDTFPQGQFVKQAVERLDQLAFAVARQEQSVAAYQRYIEQFPQGANSETAQRTLQHLQLLRACLTGNRAEVTRLAQEGQTLASYDEAARALMRVLQARMHVYMVKVLPLFVTAEGRLTDNSPISDITSTSTITNNMGSFVEETLMGKHVGDGKFVGVLITSRDKEFKGFKGVSDEEKKQFLEQFNLLLVAGVDPNAMRIKGFTPSKSEFFDLLRVKYSTGSTGEIVPTDEEGLSALEYARNNNLTEYENLLLKAGAKP